MTYHVGYGNAAGFLFNTGRLADFHADAASLQDSTNSAADSSDEEEVHANRLAGFDPITGQAKTDAEGIPAGNDMTEEEKEAEKERLIRLFERLERTGVMTVMPQNDNNDGDVSE